MRAVIQRVLNGNVVINNEKIAEIGNGYVILLGVENGDDQDKANRLALKIANLRIFSDHQGKMNLSILDVKGSALVVSQFTLMADTRKGNRPSFTDAASPDIAIPLVDFFAEKLTQIGVPTQKGKFGAQMQVTLTNDGPVTIEMQA